MRPAWPKRIFLFLIVNLLILTTISIMTSVLGVRPYLNEHGIDYSALMIFCLIWGVSGAFISLAISRWMAKSLMGVKVIAPNTSDPTARWLLDTVYRYARKSNIAKMPEVGIYNSPEVNAFATGPTKNRALVAVSTGLLQSMNKDEVDGVIGHEVAHIANGDMVTMTLVQGIVNAFVMFFARIIAFVISQRVRPEFRGVVHLLSVIVFQILFSFLGMFVVAYFSRIREYRADAGGAQLAGREKMIAALERLQKYQNQVQGDKQAAIASLKISGQRSAGLRMLLSTHPPLEQRIARLKGIA